MDCQAVEKRNTRINYTSFLSYMITRLTGPMIVACQWNTEKDNQTRKIVSNQVINETRVSMQTANKDSLRVQSCYIINFTTSSVDLTTDTRNLQSSPTGPAEHCAGGSLPRS